MKRKPLMRKGKIRKSSKCSCSMCKGHKKEMSHREKQQLLIILDQLADQGI